MKVADLPLTPSRVHCLGIGGIGLSAVAQMLAKAGVTVSGTDANASSITELMEQKGITITIARDGVTIPEGTELVLCSPAIPDTNEDKAFARDHGITVMTFPEYLGLLTQKIPTVAISGTHGKTSTTAMVAHILRTCGRKPHVIVGSLLADLGTNYIEGEEPLLVIEACEFNRSFHAYVPTYLVITNLEHDHTDTYPTFQEMAEAFNILAKKVPATGRILIRHDMPMRDIVCNGVSAEVSTIGEDATEIPLSIPGEHMQQNARMAIATVGCVGIDEDEATKAVESYHSVWRRYQNVGTAANGAVLISDYAHHPSAIHMVIDATREQYPGKHLVIAYEPHQVTRTKAFYPEIIESLLTADELILLPIYSVREENDGTLTNESIAADLKSKGKDATAISDPQEFLDRLATYSKETVVVLCSAGTWHDAFVTASA